VIKKNAFFIDFAGTIGQYSCPGNGEPKYRKTKCFHQQQVIFIPVIKIAGRSKFGTAFYIAAVL
jgi:hypothetical protein